MTRSFLFVPADSERKLAKASSVAADALILDLEDSVQVVARPAARELAAEFAKQNERVWIRVNPADTPDFELDLEAVVAAAPDGIILPKPSSVRDVLLLVTKLDELEAAHSIEAGSTKILAICTERPEALFTLHEYAGATTRLAGLSWGAEDLSAAVGASTNRDENGTWLPPYELARSLCLFAAAAAEVAAYDTVFTDFKDEAGLRRYAMNARRDGFSGMLAIHPAQVDVINEAFTPSADEIERARRIIEMFEDNPGAGVLSLDGVLLDRPHLLQARRIIAEQ